MGASLVAQLVKNLPASVRPGSVAESGRSPGEGIDYPLKNLDSDDKEPTCNAGDLGLNPGLGRSPGGGHGSPLQYSCLENPMDRGARWTAVHGVTKSRTQLRV